MSLTHRVLPLRPVDLAAPATATPAADLSQPRDYTPPPIPKPLPKPGGPIVQVAGAAPSKPSTTTNTESPASGSAASPAASPAGGSVITNVNPGSPPQPIASPQASPVAAAAATVTMTPDFKFDPASVTVKQGQTVRWINQGRAPQTVTADPARAKDKSHAAMPGGAKPFDSGVINAGGTFSHAFDVAGTHSYFSMPQEQNGMLGTVIVQ